MALRAFFHQLRASFPGKMLAVILDNASIHGSRLIKRFLGRHPDVRLFPLPTYSPEYNPTEQVWKWLKPMVDGAKTIENGVAEILSRLRKISFAWLNSRLVKPPRIGIGIWNDLLVRKL